MLIVKILLLLLIILIALFIIIFSEPLHVYAVINFDEISNNIFFNIKYYHIQINYNTASSQINIIVTTQFFTKTIRTFNLNDSEEDTELIDENQDIYNTSKYDLQIIKQTTRDIYENKDDIMDVLSLLPGALLFTDSYFHMNIGLNNNNLTIKLCNMLWMLSAPLYLTGMEIVIVPIINQPKLIIDSKINVDMQLFVLLKILIKIVMNSNLRNLILSNSDIL